MLDHPMPENTLLSPSARKDGATGYPGLEPVHLSFGQLLHGQGATIGHVYFPTSSLVSLISHPSKGGIPVELGIIGRDGMVGVPLALGDDLSAADAVVQLAGSALRSSAGDFAAAMRRRAPMRSAIRRYSSELTAQMMITATCNRNHSVEQRLARWLLMMRDRAPRGSFHLTQKYLAFMLCVRRAAVSEAAGGLQRRGLIRYARGRLEILDAAGLLAAACDCYRAWNERRVR